MERLRFGEEERKDKDDECEDLHNKEKNETESEEKID